MTSWDCVFPFVYEWVEYTACTTTDVDEGYTWCATAVDLDSKQPEADMWKYCDEGDNPEPLKEHFKEWLANNCVFPFVYEGVKHTACVDTDGTGAWCATEVDPGTNSYVTDMWKYCDEDRNPANAQLKERVQEWLANKDTARKKYGEIGDWDTSDVTSTAYLFEGATSFNDDISKWVLSSVRSTHAMFFAATSFDGNVAKWDLSSATDTSSMFQGATSFDGNVAKWNMSSVLDVSFMFNAAVSFDSNVAQWDLSSATDTSYMFSGATSFDGNVAKWDLSSTEDTFAMFRDATSFNANVANWNLSSVKRTLAMFAGALSFNQDLSGWHTAGNSPEGSIADMQCITDESNQLQCPAITCSALNGGRCCSDSNQTVPRCSSCTTQNECFRLPTVPETLVIKDTNGEPFPAEMIVGEYKPIEWNNYVDTSDVYTSFQREAPYKLVFQLRWLKPDSADEAWMQVGRNPPAGYEWDGAKGPGGVGMDSETGKIFAEPENMGSYTAWLVAVDDARPAKEGGAPAELDQVLIKKWDLAVAVAPTISSFIRSNASPNDRVNVSANVASSKECGYDEPCTFNELNSDLVETSDKRFARSDFTYAVEVTSCEGPLGKNEEEWPQFLVDVKTGFVSGSFRQEIAVNGEEQACTLDFTATAAGGSPHTIETVKITAVKSAKAKAEEATTITVTTASGTFLLLLLLVAGYKYRQHLISMRPVDFETKFAAMLASGDLAPEQLRSDRKPREIRRHDLVLVKMIGHGQFGEVWKCVLDEHFARGTPEYTVAAKIVLDAKESPEATNDLLSEASVMAQVAGHRNLVSIIGVVTRGDPLVLVLQYCERGSVLDELKTQAAEGTPVTFASKIKMALDVALGMEHLASLHFIHRDLAARNVLVADGHSTSGEGRRARGLHRGSECEASLVCKIADFGMSRGGHDGEEDKEAYYKSNNGVFPIRWTAPEAMESLRYTQASDVWAFGVVVVEMLQDGTKPYHGQSNPDVMNLVMSGGRHPKPSADCTDELFAFMLQCWHHDVAQRPPFAKVVEFFRPLAEEAAKPEVEPREDAYKRLGGADNLYNDMGFADEAVGSVCAPGEAAVHAGSPAEIGGGEDEAETGFGFGHESHDEE